MHVDSEETGVSNFMFSGVSATIATNVFYEVQAPTQASKWSCLDSIIVK